MGRAASAEVPLCTPLGCILKNWKKFGVDPLKKAKSKAYCAQWWPTYELEDGEKRPENGSLNYNSILQLMLFCRRMDKWGEVVYVDFFFILRCDHETCKNVHFGWCWWNVLAESVNRKGKKKNYCIGKECKRKCVKDGREAKDVQMLVPKGDPVNVEWRDEKRKSQNSSDSEDEDQPNSSSRPEKEF